jgi:heme a synthase
MLAHDRRLRLLRRLAWLCVAMVLAVTSLSAYLRLSKAGLGCAEWPSCYGQSQRQLQQGLPVSAEEQTATAAARLAHRVAAVLALLLIGLMVVVCVSGGPVLRGEAVLALALLALALFLAVLGRWSSAARVPAVTLGNLLGGFGMLALSVRLGVAGRPLPALHLRAAVTVAVLLVLVQSASGGLASASFSGLSCSTDWSGCLEAARSVDWTSLDPWREPTLTAQPPFNVNGALPQILHRSAALVLLLALGSLALLALRRGRPRTGWALLGLLFAQAALGLSMVHGGLPLGLALLHNLLAVGLLAALVLLV